MFRIDGGDANSVDNKADVVGDVFAATNGVEAVAVAGDSVDDVDDGGGGVIVDGDDDDSCRLLLRVIIGEVLWCEFDDKDDNDDKDDRDGDGDVDDDDGDRSGEMRLGA